MNKIDMINQVLGNLDRLNITGVANMKLLLDSVQGLQMLGQLLLKEEEDAAKAVEHEPAEN